MTAALALAGAQVPGACAEGLPLEGSLRAGYWSASALFDEREDVGSAALWLKSTPDFGDAGRLVLEGWVRNDDVLEDGPTRARLREGYWRLDRGNWDLRLGQQLVVWGRADRINPTDNLSPRDYTMLAPEDVDQRRGVVAGTLASCLGTRHYDGYLRQDCLKELLASDEAWVTPYLLQVAGEYVVEIADDVARGIVTRDAATLGAFALENPDYLATLERRATSYWSYYHRGAYPDRNHYPGLQVLAVLRQVLQ